MKKEVYFELAEKEMAGILDLIKRKGNDYSGGSEDVLENFKLAEKLDLAKAEIGLLLRMMDKVQRIKSFLAKGQLSVANESATDAARDIIGYSLALIGLMHERAYINTAEKYPDVIIPSGAPLAPSDVQFLPMGTGPGVWVDKTGTSKFRVDGILQQAEDIKKSAETSMLAATKRHGW